MACVLRGFLPSTYFEYVEGKNPCAALTIEKITHLLTGTDGWNKIKKAFCGAKEISPHKAFLIVIFLFVFDSEMRNFFPLSRKNRILTGGILKVCRGLKSDSDAEIGENSHF